MHITDALFFIHQEMSEICRERTKINFQTCRASVRNDALSFDSSAETDVRPERFLCPLRPGMS